MLVNERSVKPLALINTGTVNFDFAWDCGPNPRVSVRPESGNVPRGDRVLCELSYHPHSSEKLENYPVSCKVRGVALCRPLDSQMRWIQGQLSHVTTSA